MAEANEVASSLVGLATFAAQCSEALHKTIASYQSHQQRVRDLVDETKSLSDVLQQLANAALAQPESQLPALAIPLQRCAKACQEFELAIKLSSNSDGQKMSFRDWARLRYMGEDVDGFRRLLCGYKMTITIALTDIRMRGSLVTPEAVQGYNELLNAARADLEERLETIDDKLELLLRPTASKSSGSKPSAAMQPTSSIELLKTARADLEERLEMIDDKLELLLGQTASKSSGPEASVAMKTRSSVMVDLAWLRETKEDIRQCIKLISDADEAALNEPHIDDREPEHGSMTRTIGGMLADESVEEMTKHMKDTWQSPTSEVALPQEAAISPEEAFESRERLMPKGSSGDHAIDSVTEEANATKSLSSDPRVGNQDAAVPEIMDDDSVGLGHSSDTYSLWDLPGSEVSSATSGIPSGIIRLSMQELADTVLDGTGITLTLLAAKSHPALKPEKVLDGFKQRLGEYYGDLKSLSATIEHERIIHLLKKSKSTITNKVRKLLGLVYREPLRSELRERMSLQEKNDILLYLLNNGATLPERPITQSQDTAMHEDFADLQSDSDDESLEDGLHPEISAARSFLKDGMAMQKLQTSIRNFILDLARKYDIPQCVKPLPRSLPDIIDELCCRVRLQLPCTAVPRGKRRIKWTCSCGVSLYDDFDEQFESAGLDELEAYLHANRPIRHQSDGWIMAGNAALQTFRWGLTTAQVIVGRLQHTFIKRDSLPTHRTETANATCNAATIPETRNLLYLLHCSSIGDYGVKLRQDLIHDDLNDQELFKFLRTIYCRERKDIKWFTLRNTTNISLCKFFVDHSYYASVQMHASCMHQPQGCVCLPPRSLIGREYQCHPTPPDPTPLPPFGKNYLMHYFLNPDHLSIEQKSAFKQFPKKMNERLHPAVDAFPPGWGIYFEDGWNFKTTYFLVLLATIIGSLIFGVSWSIFKLDIQGAFAITSYWAAVVSMALGFLALKSVDKI